MKITNKIMAFWYFARAIFGGVAVVLLFLLIKKLSEDSEEEKPAAPKVLSFKPSNKDLKESLEIVKVLDEIYKV